MAGFIGASGRVSSESVELIDFRRFDQWEFFYPWAQWLDSTDWRRTANSGGGYRTGFTQKVVYVDALFPAGCIDVTTSTWWNNPTINPTTGFSQLGTLYCTPLNYFDPNPGPEPSWIMNPPGMKWNSSPDVADLDGYYIITLQAETRLRARNIGPTGWSNSQRMVVKASDVFAYEWSHIAESWVFVEHVDFMNPTSINIAGYTCDCNAVVNIPGVSAGSTVEITPTVSGRNNYTYTMSAQRPKVVGLGRAYHPNFTTAPSLASLQNQFDTVSDFLRQDSDGCIRDDDLRLNPSSGTFNHALFYGDDVPVYVNFHVENNPPGALTFRPLNGIDFTQNVYYDLDHMSRVTDLIESNMAEVLQVWRIVGGAVLGATQRGSGRMVLAQSADAKVVGHEWGHARGVSHRGEGGNLSANSAGDPEALMFGDYVASGTEINRFERAYLQEVMY